MSQSDEKNLKNVKTIVSMFEKLQGASHQKMNFPHKIEMLKGKFNSPSKCNRQEVFKTAGDQKGQMPKKTKGVKIQQNIEAYFQYQTAGGSLIKPKIENQNSAPMKSPGFQVRSSHDQNASCVTNQRTSPKLVDDITTGKKLPDQ